MATPEHEQDRLNDDRYEDELRWVADLDEHVDDARWAVRHDQWKDGPDL